MLMPTQAALSQTCCKITRLAAAHTADLARLLPLWPHELDDMTTAGRDKRIALLRKSLRAERRRGLAGHWTYDLARHSALLRCYKREVELAQASGIIQSPHGLDAKAG